MGNFLPFEFLFCNEARKSVGNWGGNKHEKQQQKSPHFLVIVSFQTSYHSNFYFLVFLLSYSNNFKFVMLEGDANIKLKMKQTVLIGIEKEVFPALS